MSLTPSLGRRLVGFTLIELLIVITIIAVLAGFLFPVIGRVQERARTVQAKNEEIQIVNAITAFYTEYGRYPCGSQNGGDGQDYFAADDTSNSALFDVLRALPNNGNAQTYNPKAVIFLQATIAKDLANPKGGIGQDGRYHDLWGSCYRVRIDNNYSGAVPNPYSKNAGFDPIQLGAIIWSLGPDQDGAKLGTSGGDKRSGRSADDVISWQ